MTAQHGIESVTNSREVLKMATKSLVRTVNHVNLYTRQLERVAAFYSDVIGLELVTAFTDESLNGESQMTDDSGNVICKVGGLVQPRHYAFQVSEDTFIAFFDQGPEFDGPGGGFHHLAFGVESEEALEQAIARLHAHGVPTSPIVDHGMFKSCYFMDPEGRNLEITVQLRKLGIYQDFSASEELAIAVQARNAAPDAPVLTTTT
jgi:catechol 2,3-dioxygenase-like lactoylglutathione lyase family enzyme